MACPLNHGECPLADFDFQTAFDRVHERMNDICDEVTSNKTKLAMLVGNGQPGLVSRIQGDIDGLKEFKAKADATVKTTATFWGIMWAAFGLLGHFIWDYFHHK
jgi:hypothetical protein